MHTIALFSSLILTAAASAQCNQSATSSLTDAFRAYGNPAVDAPAPAGGAWSFYMGQPGITPLFGIQPSSLPTGITWYGRFEQPYFVPAVGPVFSPDSAINQSPFHDRDPHFTGLMLHPGNSTSQDCIAVFTAQLPTTIMAMSAQVEVLGDLSNGVRVNFGEITGGARHDGIATTVLYGSAPVILTEPLAAPLSLAAGESVFVRVNNNGAATEDWCNLDFNLTLRGGPAIMAPPHISSACINHASEIRILAAGSGPLQFQWKKDGQTLTNDGHISGATTDRLQIATLRPEDAAEYTCVVTGPCGNLTSAPAHLAFCNANFNCDGTTDFFDYLDFVDAFASAASLADFNADGTIDFFDYLDFVDAFSSGC